MLNKPKSFFNWGRNVKICPNHIKPKNMMELKKLVKKKVLLLLGIKDPSVMLR